MQISHRARVGLIALVAMVGASISSAASADNGIVRISVVKGGWFVGANGGWGTLIFHGRRYPLSVGGVDAGLVFGLSQTTLVGRVINIRRPSDVAGVYVAAGGRRRGGDWRTVDPTCQRQGRRLAIGRPTNRLDCKSRHERACNCAAVKAVSCSYGTATACTSLMRHMVIEIDPATVPP